MVDIVSIVVAVLALLGTLTQAAVNGWLNFHSEERKRLDHVQQVLAKYRDPLCRATEDLSYKLINIANNGFAACFVSETATERERTYAILHTSYVIGQFFAWVHIIRHDTQFLIPPDTDSKGREINSILKSIRMILLDDAIHAPFMLWSGEQLAISEIMIVRDHGEDSGQVRCMGFATFCQRWKADEEFREWFTPIVEGLVVLSKSENEADFERVQSLQHHLVDLLEQFNSSPDMLRARDAPEWCRCKACLRDGQAVTISIQSDPLAPKDRLGEMKGKEKTRWNHGDRKEQHPT
ncbi:hypothetical protein V5O48_013035 [Marasmius crinis-equi]|uniref:Uncharacterized protein n=1 Tax=Marasmius crinis-equi TaxID=585013 RepID=A0ABR3F166_9AGAR